MTIGEAKAYLSIADSDDISDCYDTFIFEQKQFFKQKNIHPKIFESKFLKIDKAREAFAILGIEEKKTTNAFLFEKPLLKGMILADFHLYNTVKNSLFSQLFNASTLSEIQLISGYLLENELNYAATWEPMKNKLSDQHEFKNWTDPMYVLKDIQSAEKMGVIHVNDFLSTKQEGFNYLKAEINRLNKLNH